MWWKRRDERPAIEQCIDCNAEEGAVHDLFCTRELCPYCFDQLAGCDCIDEVLALSADERRAVDEYVDDSVEPLKSIMKRWEAALEREGRVRFIAAPNLCRRCGEVSPAFFRVADDEWKRFVPAHLRGEVFCRNCYDVIREQVQRNGG